MERELVIASEHSNRNPKKKLKIKLQGGSPWFAYIWIDDVCYTIIKKKYVSIYRTK